MDSFGRKNPAQPVMDIRPSPPSGPSQPSVNADTAFSESVKIPPPEPAAEARSNVTAEPRLAAEPEVPDTNQPQKSQKPKKEKGPRAPIGAIIMAIIVAGALAGVTVFAYMRSNSTSTDKGTENQDSANSEVQSSDVDDVTSEIDKSLNGLDDSKDFQESELSDTTLGL